MEGTLIYYDLLTTKNNQISFLDENITFQKKMKEFLLVHKKEDLLYRNDEYLISIEDIQEEYIFGSYGKIQNLGEKRLTRGRTKENFETTDLKSIKELVESYTYFYLCIETQKCIILHNSNFGAFKTQFAKFLLHHFKLSSIFDSLTIENRISDDIPNKVGKLNHFERISYTYTTDKVPENEFLSIKEISKIKSNQIKTATVQLYFEPDKDYTENAKELSNVSAYIDNFSNFRIDTDSIAIDVVEKILSKKVNIPISDEDLNSIDKIKTILIENMV